MNILLLSSGGGGGTILRSLKGLFRRDLLVSQKTDARYAERLRRVVTARFLDTNEFSLSDVPKDERLVIGANTTRRLGSMHNPELARQALEESRDAVESLLSRFSVVVIIGTGGKGTGTGTMFPLAQMARRQRKLVIPIFVRPSFERHEVEKRRYDQALGVAEQFDSAGIRLIEILNDRGYTDANPEPQSVVWERMNLPIARALRGLLYVLSDLSQVDPSDLSSLFGGTGRLRIGFSELDPPAGEEPGDDQIQAAVRACWDNEYCAFDGLAGTSLVCIQGDWSNVVDGKIKGHLSALANRGLKESSYNPLYARASRSPRPWGVTAVFAEYTGNHPALDIDWSAERITFVRVNPSASEARGTPRDVAEGVAVAPPIDAAAPSGDPVPAPAFATFWDFARALNRSDPEALKLASNGAEGVRFMDGPELRKLVGTFWFRSVFARLSSAWQEHLLGVLVEHVTISNHGVKSGRRTIRLNELAQEERRRLMTDSGLPETVRSDLQFLVTVATLWGEDAVSRFTFTDITEAADPSRFELLLQPFRHS